MVYLLFYNNCRPLVVMAKFELFNSELDVVSYIVKTRENQTLESSNSEIEYKMKKLKQVFLSIRKGLRLQQQDIANLKDDDLVNIILANIDRSWTKSGGGTSVSIVRDTKLLQIINTCAGEDGILRYDDPITFVNPNPLNKI